MLGLDQDDAVGGPGAVDGARRGIFENGDGFDVVGVEEVQRVAGQRGCATDADPARFGGQVLDRDPVDHVQWLVAGADRGATADPDLHTGPGPTAVLRDVHAGDTAPNQIVDVRDHADVGLVHVDRRDRPGDGDAALGTVSGYHDLVQHHGLTPQRELHRRRLSGPDRDLLRHGSVPDETGRHTVGSRGDVAQRERTVGSRGRPALRSFDHYAGTGHGSEGRGVRDASGDAAGLRGKLASPQQADDECENDLTRKRHSSALHRWEVECCSGSLRSPSRGSRARGNRRTRPGRPHHALESRVPEAPDCCPRERRSVAEPACDGMSRLSNPTPHGRPFGRVAFDRGEALMRDLGDVHRDRRPTQAERRAHEAFGLSGYRDLEEDSPRPDVVKGSCTGLADPASLANPEAESRNLSDRGTPQLAQPRARRWVSSTAPPRSGALKNSPRLTPSAAPDRGAVARPAPGTRTGHGTPAARGERTRQFNSPATCEISPANPLGCLFRKAFGSRASSPGAPLSEVVTESAISNARNGANSHHHGGLITMTRCALFSFAGASGSCLLEG